MVITSVMIVRVRVLFFQRGSAATAFKASKICCFVFGLLGLTRFKAYGVLGSPGDQAYLRSQRACGIRPLKTFSLFKPYPQTLIRITVTIKMRLQKGLA